MPGEVWAHRTLVTSPYHYGLCTSKKQFNAEMKYLKIPKRERPVFLPKGKDAAVQFFQSAPGIECAIVCLGSTKGRPFVEVAGLLVHEAVHIWQWFREGLNENNPSSEFEAYSIQSIAVQLMHLYEQSIQESQ